MSAFYCIDNGVHLTNTMKIDLLRVDIVLKPVLANLLELYLHDFTDVTPFEGTRDVDESGRFGYKYLDHYWKDPARHPFIIKADGKIAGFVFVNLSHEEGEEPNTHGISEFLIIRKYRHKGVGEQAAQRIFDMFPGKWRIGQLQGNSPAQQFWKNVIGSYTQGNFKESVGDKGPYQTFDNSGLPDGSPR